jgi:hypothetical protein
MPSGTVETTDQGLSIAGRYYATRLSGRNEEIDGNGGVKEPLRFSYPDKDAGDLEGISRFQAHDIFQNSDFELTAISRAPIPTRRRNTASTNARAKLD